VSERCQNIYSLKSDDSKLLKFLLLIRGYETSLSIEENVEMRINRPTGKQSLDYENGATHTIS
jgi:hypothetical protein